MNESYLLIIFSIAVVIMLLIDLGVFNKKQHEVSTKEAAIWTLVWITVSCVFGGFIYYQFGSEKAIEYFAAYLTEKSLSLDNIFVFVLIFSYYQIKEIHKHKILFWGIIGAVVLRAIFIFSGIWLIEITYLPEFYLFDSPIQVNLVLTIFAVFLIVAGIKSFKPKDDDSKDYGNTFAIKLFKKFFSVTDEMKSGKFMIKKDSVRYLTPLFLAMVTIEGSDVVFAVDSIPAIFAISQDPIILYTSNIFAILGLRSMYFLLSSVIKYFKRLNQGIACILVFIGIKMIVADFYHISSLFSLCFIFSMVALSIIVSVLEKNMKNKKGK
jgi:tellurite resistance protein TerC